MQAQPWAKATAQGPGLGWAQNFEIDHYFCEIDNQNPGALQRVSNNPDHCYFVKSAIKHRVAQRVEIALS